MKANTEIIMKEAILNLSTAIRTPILPEVKDTIKHIPTDYDGVVNYSTNICEWLKPVIDLSDYCVYPRNGITEGLDWWYNRESRGVHMDTGDYQWVSPRGNMYDESVKYQSIPSSIDGNWRETTGEILDLAYVGSTRIQKIDHNADIVFYSLSKSFGVRNIRTGWIFTRMPDERLEALTHSAKYYNYFAHSVAEKIISSYDIDYVHKRLYKEQNRVCEHLDIQPSDSVWLATSTHDDYIKFRRQGNLARICLAGVYEL